MGNLYFSNAEIVNFLCTKLRQSGIEFQLLDWNERDVLAQEHSANKIHYVNLVLNLSEDCSIALHGHLTSIFITNKIEIMFFNDEDREKYSSSDTGGNVVYNGLLKDKTNEEILQTVADMVVLFKDAESFGFSEEEIDRIDRSYPRCNYTINIYKKDAEPQNKVFENITFCILPRKQEKDKGSVHPS